MKVEDLKFDSVLDVVNVLNNDLMQRMFAINLVDACDEVYKKSNGKISGVLLEKGKGRFYNFDIAVITRALVKTVIEKIDDKNKQAKVELFFVGTNVDNFKNLRFVLNFLSFIGLVANVDKSFLYMPGLYIYENDSQHAIFNTVGFDAKKIIELLLDRDLINELNNMSDMNKNKITLVSYGATLNNVLVKRGIDINEVLKVSQFAR